MKNNLRIAILFTLVTTVLFGLVYPLVLTGLAQLLFPFQANGSLLVRDGLVIGSAILGQTFASPGYFHSRLPVLDMTHRNPPAPTSAQQITS
jgi:potassium-transporting ATPase KdpC subunit